MHGLAWVGMDCWCHGSVQAESSSMVCQGEGTDGIMKHAEQVSKIGDNTSAGFAMQQHCTECDAQHAAASCEQVSAEDTFDGTTGTDTILKYSTCRIFEGIISLDILDTILGYQ